MRAVSTAPRFNLFRHDGQSLEKVLDRQQWRQAGKLKTLLGDAKRQSKRLALGLEPDLRQLFSSVLQGCPLCRGRLHKKIHSAPPWVEPPFSHCDADAGREKADASRLHGCGFDSCGRGAMVQQTSSGVMRMAPLALTDSPSPAADPALQPPAKPMTSPPA